MTDYDPEDKTLISPATTPGSVDNRNIIITNYYIPQTHKTEKWYKKLRSPIAIFTASAFQIMFFLVSTKEIHQKLRFEPNKQIEFWRFITYMLMHDSWLHLSLNVTLQCLFATYLRTTQGGCRIFFVYISGGIGGALGAACVRPDLLVGASAGVYALLISYVSYIILSFQSMKHRFWKCASVATIIISDIFYNVFHYYGNDAPTISYGAHIFGALTGFLVGLLVYSNNIDNKSTLKLIFYTSLVLLTALLITLIGLDFHINKCKFKYLNNKLLLC